MKKILILLALLLAGCEATDKPKTEICTLDRSAIIRIMCVDGVKFVVYANLNQGGLAQFIGADGKPFTCSCGGK